MSLAFHLYLRQCIDIQYLNMNHVFVTQRKLGYDIYVFFLLLSPNRVVDKDSLPHIAIIAPHR